MSALLSSSLLLLLLLVGFLAKGLDIRLALGGRTFWNNTTSSHIGLWKEEGLRDVHRF